MDWDADLDSSLLDLTILHCFQLLYYLNAASRPIYRVSEKKLDSLLFHHIFALTAANCMKYSRST